MKILKYILFLLAIWSCENTEVPTVFKKPVIEVITAFSRSNTDGEVILDLSEVFQNIDEVGIVWSERNNPTITDNKLALNDLTTDRLLSFEIPNLQKGKTYFVKGYYKQASEIVYSSESSWVQNFSGEWRRLKSPPISADEYIYSGNLEVGLSADALQCYKVNAFTNEAISQIYFADFGEWNPDFWGNRSQIQKPRPLLFNPIHANFVNKSAFPLTLYGGGHFVNSRGIRSYQRDMFVLQSNGNWEPYPGAEAETTSFGIQNLVYVLENLPNGKLWRFDYGDLSWKNIGNSPYQKPAKYIGFDSNERFFMLVEPTDNQGISKEFYEYLVAENKWIRKADFIGENRRNGASFVIENRLYYGFGKNPDKGIGFRDLWEYNVDSNSWKKVADYPGAGTTDLLAIGSIGRAFIGFGKRVKQTSVGGEDFQTAIDFWQFRPK